MPRFSIVIPLYNKAHFIAQTLQSVLNQSFTDFEVIVINDGSTDNSLEVVQTFTDPRITIFSQTNKGLSASRNMGISLAKANYIALLDADDLWEPNHLNTLHALLLEYPDIQFLGTGYKELYANGRAIVPKQNLPPGFKGILNDFFEASLCQPIIHPSSLAFNKAIIQQIGGFNTGIDYTEDVDFYIRAALTYPCAYASITTCIYRMDSENQITKSGFSNKRIADFDSYLINNPTNMSLRKYINHERYFLAISYKLEKNKELFIEMKSKLDLTLLTGKQRFLLHAPLRLVYNIKKIKYWFLMRGQRLTSF